MFPTSSSGAITSIFGVSSIALSNLMIPASICILACLVAVSLPMLLSWQKRLLLLAALYPLGLTGIWMNFAATAVLAAALSAAILLRLRRELCGQDTDRETKGL